VSLSFCYPLCRRYLCDNHNQQKVDFAFLVSKVRMAILAGSYNDLSTIATDCLSHKYQATSEHFEGGISVIVIDCNHFYVKKGY